MEYIEYITTIALWVITHISEIKLQMGSVFGAFVLYILHRHNDKQPFSLFKAIGIPLENYSTIIHDMFWSSLIGGITVFCITDPATMPQAIVSGLGMTGILSAHSK